MVGRTFKVVWGQPGLNEIFQEWTMLLKYLAGKRFFHYPEWYQCYLEILEKDSDAVCFILMFNDRRLSGIFPLKKKILQRNKISFRYFELPGENYFSLRDIIVPQQFQTGTVLADLTSYMRSRDDLDCDYIKFIPVLDDSCLMGIIKNEKKHLDVNPLDRCDFLTIRPYGDIESNLSKNMRTHLRKSMKKARKLGDISTETIAGGKELGVAFNTFLEIESSGWKGEAGTKTAIKCNEILVQFYRLLLKRFEKLGAARIEILRISGSPVSAHLSVLIGDTVYALKIGYDEKYAKLSPGVLHMKILLEQYDNDSKIKYFNLVTGSSAPWHDRWKPDSYTTFCVYYFNKTLKGRFCQMGLKIKRSIFSVR